MVFNIKLVLLTVAIAGAVLLTWHYKATIEENKRLRVEISTANNTINLLDKKFEAERIITENSGELLEGIRNAPKTDDAPVANVLDKLLDKL